MKLSEFNQDIATACDARPKLVGAIQKETFRRLLAALDKGERVIIPEFGMFTVKEIAGEGGEAGKKSIRFRRRDAATESPKKKQEAAPESPKEKQGNEDAAAKKEAKRQRRAKAAENAAPGVSEEAATSTPQPTEE
jgi:nucleoid DNA-binding protein